MTPGPARFRLLARRRRSCGHISRSIIPCPAQPSQNSLRFRRVGYLLFDPRSFLG
jgi:hypothetical protein